MVRVKSKKKLLIGLAAFTIIAGGAKLFLRLPPENEANREIVSFTIEAERGALPYLINASGELKAVRSVNVSPDRQGILESLYVNEGDIVEKGEIIAKMEGGDYLYRLNEVKANFQNDRSMYLRRKALLEEGAITFEEYDEYMNRYLLSKARLEQRKVEGEELFVKAPFKGVVTRRYAEPGSFVAPSTRASSLAGSSSSSIVELSQGLEVSAKVPESDIARIILGQEATIRIDSFPDKRFSAKVSKIAPRASENDNVTSFDVKLMLLKKSKLLKIGMTADIEFKAGKTSVNTLIPTVAIVTEKGVPGVLIVGKNNMPTFQKVELGNSSGSKTAVLDGLKPGDLIFIDLPPWANKKID